MLHQIQPSHSCISIARGDEVCWGYDIRVGCDCICYLCSTPWPIISFFLCAAHAADSAATGKADSATGYADSATGKAHSATERADFFTGTADNDTQKVI